MESRGPVILTGVRVDDSHVTGQISRVKNKADVLYGHQTIQP
jgi:hypothetical protein